MSLVILVNILFAGVNIKWALEAFREDRQVWGWIFLVTSALCTACVLLEIL